MYAATGIYRKLKRLRRRLNNPGFWVLFGDQAFPASDHSRQCMRNMEEKLQDLHV
jgi:hypothetical protein